MNGLPWPAAAAEADTIAVLHRQKLAVDEIPCQRIAVGEPDDYKA